MQRHGARVSFPSFLSDSDTPQTLHVTRNDEVAEETVAVFLGLDEIAQAEFAQRPDRDLD